MSDDWRHQETDPGAGLPPEGFLSAHRLGEPARSRALEAARQTLGQRPAELARRRRLDRTALAAAAVLLVGLLGVALRGPGGASRASAAVSGDSRPRVMSLRIERTDETDRTPYRLDISYRPPAEAGEEEDPR